jgi:hypothetical protein
MTILCPACATAKVEERNKNGEVDFIVEYSIKIDTQGNIYNDVVTNKHSFAEVYAGFHVILQEVKRQIDERRNCPYNPSVFKQIGAASK